MYYNVCTEDTMFRRRRRAPRKRMDSGEAFALVVLGVFLGTVFTFGMNYWNQPVTREESEHVNATFSGFREQSGHQKRKLRVGNNAIITGSDSPAPIILEFVDHEHLIIDECCINDELLVQLQAIKTGTTLSCIVHPNSNTVLEVVADNMILIDFDDTVALLSSEQRGFYVFGLIMYIGALYGLLNLLPKRR